EGGVWGMAELAEFVAAVERYNDHVTEEVRRARSDVRFGEELRAEWKALRGSVGVTRTPTGIELPRVALPETDGAGEVARDGLLGKVGEGGVAIDTVDDMERLYAGFDFQDPHLSVSMTINGPAPVILAMYVAAARRDAVRRLREQLGHEPDADTRARAEAEAG